MSEGLNSSWIILAGALLIIGAILGLIVYTYIRLDRDYAVYEKNRASILESSAIGDPVDGQNGTNGKRAYDVYIDANPIPHLTYPQYLAKFVGNDGINGIDAPPAVDGEHGKDGSTGFHGDHGIAGEDGENGSKGITGVPGDSFVSVYVSANPADDIIQDTNTNLAPTGHPSCEFITESTSTVRYFYNGHLLTTIEIISSSAGDLTSYTSFIIYQNDKIIGITSPVPKTLSSMFPLLPLNLQFIVTQSGIFTGIKYRAISSLNRGLTLSSFTTNVVEKNLMDNSFTYSRIADPDPFVEQLYSIITNNSLLNSRSDYYERCVISEAKDETGMNALNLQL